MKRKNSEIIIRPLKLSDINFVMTWVNDPEVVKHFQHFREKFTEKEEISFLKKILKSENDFVFSVFLKKSGEYIGQGAVNQISWENKLGRLSLMIKKKHWGKGYAQRTIALLLSFAFNKLKLNKIWLMAYATNKKAVHIYEKLGFKKEGFLREEYFWRGKHHDIVRMGILKNDFKKIRPARSGLDKKNT